MSAALESLDELAQDVEAAINEEADGGNGRRFSSDEMSFSIRDLDHDATAEETTSSKLDMLQAWQHLVKELFDHEVFLQYVPALEKLFYQVSFFDESLWHAVKAIVDALAECVDNSEKGACTECRYITLMEVLSSFGSHWELSHNCEDVWTSMGRKPNLDSTPTQFRRDAYDFLMSLEWVPNSKSLAEVCGVQGEDDVGEHEAPRVVQSIFGQIRSTPLPRHDCIHRLLNRLNEETSATIAISSPLEDAVYRKSSRSGQGLGKTTLAAMVTSHPSVRSTFCVLWLRLNRTNLDGGGMNYRQYISYLDSLCEQLEQTPDWPRPMIGMEEKSLQEKREEEKMFQVKREMAKIIGDIGKRVLMVLDDVYDDQEIEWFWFSDRQSLLVTTTSSSLSVDWTLELDTLSEEEALELFLTEADYPPSHVLRTSIEAKSIVHRCGYHPLTIRTAARWFRLKQVTAGVVKGLEELNSELSACTSKLRHSRKSSSAISPAKILVEVMNLMLSPVLAAGGRPTTLMKLCLSSMAVVFENEIPLEAVHLLWGHLLRTEADAIHELGDNLTINQLRKRVRFISEALTSLGLLSITEKDDISHVEIHHEMQSVFAYTLAREMQFGSSQAETIARWHEAFASAYLAKKVESDRDGVEDNCRGYALEKLLYHMLKSGMFQKVAVLLRDERFLRERLDFMGPERGAITHIEDSKRLRDAMEADESINADPTEVMVSIVVTVGSYLVSYAEDANDDQAMEAAKALYLIGTILAQEGALSDALSQFKAALKMVPKISSISGFVLYSISTVYLARNDNEKGLKNIKECLKVMKEAGETNALYAEALLLKGDALMTNNDYKGAMEHYDYALEKLYSHSANNRVEIGIALGRKGRLYQVMGDLDAAFNIMDECVKWKLKLNEDSRDLATVYNFLGDICFEKDRREDALDYYDKAYRIFEFHKNETDPTDLHIINGKVDALNGYPTGCRESFELAQESMRERRRTMMERTAYDYRFIARTYMENDDFANALNAFSECLEQTADQRDDSLERSSALFDMGQMHLRRKETEMALQCLQQSLKIRILKVGESGIVISTLEEIGKLHMAVKENAEALSFFTKALELSERVHGVNSERVAVALYNLASVKAETNDNVEALAMFGECLDIRRRTLNANDPLLADALEALGKMHMKQGKYDKSYQCFIEALDSRQASMGDSHPSLAETLHLLGVVARKGGDCERALHFLLDALHIRKSFEDQGDTVATLLEIGHVHRQLGDAASALGCYEKCIEILQDNFGKSDPRLGDVFLPLGHAKRDLGFIDEALKAYERGK